MAWRRVRPHGHFLLLVLLSSFTFSACISAIPIRLEGGSLELNPRLRADFLASAGMTNGRFFSNSACPDIAGPQHECHFLSVLRPSTLDGNTLQRLRRSEFLWIESEGFPQLGFEWILRDVTVLAVEDDTTRELQRGSFGACGLGQWLDAETRQPIPGTKRIFTSPSQLQLFANHVEVAVQECAAPIPTIGVSETLMPLSTNCAERSVADLAPPPAPDAPQLVPLCLKALDITAPRADLSYTLIPRASPKLDVSEVWRNSTFGPRTLTPHLKVVPIDGVRTLSRRMTHVSTTVDPSDGSRRLTWTWRVEAEGELWRENFSPQIFVNRARVRKGPWMANDRRGYLVADSLDIGRTDCLTRTPNSNGTEFDIPLCQPEQAELLHVTPAYRHNTFAAQAVDDNDRIIWEVQVRVPAGSTLVTERDPVFLELDLTAMSPVTTTGSGLEAAPPGRDLGRVRVGTTAPQPGFTLRNLGNASARIDTLTIGGRDAGEFATRVTLTRAARTRATGTTPNPVVTAPFQLPAGASAEIAIVPGFRNAGDKQASLGIAYRDVRGSGTLQVGLVAQAVSPWLTVLPQQLNFYVAASGVAAPHAERAVLMANDGGIAIHRRNVALTGPQAPSFQVLRAEVGLSPVDLRQPLILNPGESELYRLRYAPGSAGEHRATLVIDTNEGQINVPLRGECLGECRQAPGYRWQEPPSIRVVPVSPSR